MLTIDDCRRFRERIYNNLMLFIGRSIVKYVSASTSSDHQKLQVTALADETLSDVDRIQEYGLETYPKTDSEAICLFFGGNRSHGIIIGVGDRRYRLTDLAEGEVSIYTYEDSNSGGHRIHLKSGQEIEVNGNTIDINSGNVVTIDSNGTISITSTNATDINGSAVTINCGLTPTGVVTGACACSFTGLPHPDISKTVKASK